MKFRKFILWLIADDKRITRFSKILWAIILSLLVMILFSCSPVKRLNKIHENHPYLFEAKTDTILHRDTIQVIVPGIQIDTSVHYTKLFDTIVINEKHITTTVWQNGDTVFVNTEAEPVFIYVPYEVKIPYTKYVSAPTKQWKWYHFVVIGFFVVFLLIMIYNFLY